MNSTLIADILSSTILFAIPLMLVALGGMFSERSGIINIALEGIMIIGALISCLFLSAINKQYEAVNGLITTAMRDKGDIFQQMLAYCRDIGVELPEELGKIKSVTHLVNNGFLTRAQVSEYFLANNLISGYTATEMSIYQLVTRSPQLVMLGAALVAMLSGMLYSLLLAFAAVHLKADQTIGGTALNMLAPAFAIMLSWAIQGQGNTTINLPAWKTITGDTSTFFGRLLFKECYLTTFIAIGLLLISILVLYKTKLGLRLRACGEHPQAAASVGISVYKMRYIGVLFSGALGGLGGLAFTMAAGSGFQSSVAGYGFLALAVMIFGNWKPVSILLASIFFALFKVVGSYVNSIPFLPKFDGVAAKDCIYQMVPYIVTMIVLVLTGKKSRAPKAEGIPYDKGAR